MAFVGHIYCWHIHGNDMWSQYCNCLFLAHICKYVGSLCPFSGIPVMYQIYVHWHGRRYLVDRHTCMHMYIWKRAIVRPLLKKPGLDRIFKTYRPVSNLNFISKLLKSAVLVQIQEHLYSQKLLPQYQSSYRVNFSTETLLMKLVDDILNGMEAQEVTALVALNLSAAFDLVTMIYY